MKISTGRYQQVIDTATARQLLAGREAQRRIEQALRRHQKRQEARGAKRCDCPQCRILRGEEAP